ncbi:MAG TPA: c-type cytochrome [Terriglobales bacterium]|nr:c-type cytochrome [Terriglobales bacterium]
MALKPTVPWLFIVLCTLLGMGSAVAGQFRQNASPPHKPGPAFEALSEPTGSGRCVVCHRAEVEGYARSAMAHSLREAGNEPQGTVNTPNATIAIHSSPTGYWQSLHSGGDVTDYRIDYVIGSGNHASGYLLDLGGHLFQSPVAYYKSRQTYDLAPGYEKLPNPDFTRPVAEACLFCHAGDALHIPETSNRYRSPPFSTEAITCERCHGSVEAHLADPRAGTIVNPAKLEPAARNSICEQCHLLGVGRVLNPGKTFSDFRPGEPLEQVFTTYVNALPPGADSGKIKVISHVEQLARSTCARMSNGRLWCGTCHDPHDQPADPVAYFRSKCLTCHTGTFAASHPPKESNCIGCHMPRRDAKDGGHTAFTDHRIQRFPTPQTALPETADISAWREPAPALQKRNLGIAYVNTGAERASFPLVVRGYRLLTEVQDQFSTDSALFTSIGTALLLGKKSSEAELAFDRALQLDPGSVAGETNAASAYLQAGDTDQAIVHLQRAVTLDPLHLPAIAPLIDLYKQRGDLAKAAELSNRVSAAIDRQSDAGKTGAPAGVPPQPADAVFKNIQVLKGVPADQLIPAMRFISASLGVQCGYCHVPNHFEKDDKKPKQTARAMMRMMFAIDKDAFAGNRAITCYSCHRRSPQPEAAPQIADAADSPRVQPAAEAVDKLVAGLPTTGEVIAGYIRALGGADAIASIHSRAEKGTLTLSGKPVSIEILEQDPAKQCVVEHLPGGEDRIVLDSEEAWAAAPGRRVRQIRGADLDGMQMDADLHFPLDLSRTFAELRMEYPEKIGDREFYVLRATRPGKPAVKLYFDQQSYLLARLVRYAESPLGREATQIDFTDYREVNGVKTPFHWTVAQSDGISTIQLEQVRANIPVDAASFAKPHPASKRSRNP